MFLVKNYVLHPVRPQKTASKCHFLAEESPKSWPRRDGIGPFMERWASLLSIDSWGLTTLKVVSFCGKIMKWPYLSKPLAMLWHPNKLSKLKISSSKNCNCQNFFKKRLVSGGTLLVFRQGINNKYTYVFIRHVISTSHFKCYQSTGP